jgi:L-ascorbate metabolism protein UlaG (beta-lactamase superfamily)
VTVRHLGDPTALIDIGGVRMITDPMFDLPGEWLLPIRHAAGSQDRQN